MRKFKYQKKEFEIVLIDNEQATVSGYKVLMRAQRDLAVHKGPNGWVVVDLWSGVGIKERSGSRDAAVNSVLQMIESVGVQNYISQIEEYPDINPRY